MPLPGRSVYTVASDPQTRLSTLQRLSATASGGVKSLISRNLAQRYHPSFDPSELVLFDREIIRDSFLRTSCNKTLMRFAMFGDGFAKDAYEILHRRNVISIIDIVRLSDSNNQEVAERAVSHSDMPYDVLVFIVINRPIFAPLAFDMLSARGKIDQKLLWMLVTSNCPEVLEKIAAHPEAEPSVIEFTHQRM